MATANGNRISKQKLNIQLKELPLPVQEHCKRCRQIATFLLERIKGEEWFFDAGLNAEHIAYAVYLHDLGKVAIPRDNLYAGHNVAKAKQTAYRRHVEAGVETVEVVCGVTLSEFAPGKPETYLLEAITQHHECVDGCGFPAGLQGEEISVTGKIAAIADTVDNLYFVGASDVQTPEELINRLENLSGTALDENLLGAMLSDREAFIGFISFLENRQRNKRKNDGYGLQIRFTHIQNIIENEVREYLAEFVINDPYYGLVSPLVYIPVAAISSQAARLTLLMVERLCLMLDRIRERGGEIPRVTISVDASCFTAKRFPAELVKLLKKYDIRPHTICLMVDESGIVERDDINYIDIFAVLRRGGYRMALNCLRENTTLVTSIDALEVDYLFIHPEYTHKLNANANAFGVASGVLEIAHNLHVSVVFLGTDSRATEKTLLRMRAALAAGELYGTPVREADFVSAMVRSGGDA